MLLALNLRTAEKLSVSVSQYPRFRRQNAAAPKLRVSSSGNLEFSKNQCFFASQENKIPMANFVHLWKRVLKCTCSVMLLRLKTGPAAIFGMPKFSYLPLT